MRPAEVRMRFFRFAESGRTTYPLRSVQSTMAAALRLLIPAAAIVTVLLIVSWRAGHEAGELEGQPLSAEITVLGQRVASAQLELNREKKRTAELENALKSSGKSSSLDQVLQLKQQLLQAQAEANQYKSITQREQRTSNDGDYLIEALSNPGARLFPMKGSEAAADSTAYALIVEKTRLMFIGSKLPKLADGRQFQL